MFNSAFYRFLFTSSVLALVSASPDAELVTRADCVVDSVSSASSISSCSAVTINAFTVANGSTLTLSPKSGATITMAGDVTFAQTSSTGPLFTIDGESITFKGAGFKFDGNGAKYWDGNGTNGGVDKPHPFLKFKGSWNLLSIHGLEQPLPKLVSIGNSNGLTFDSITVDNSAGDTNSLGHNTDGFDVSADNVTIQNSIVKNQDDCIAINSGSTIIFKNNQCSGGHGISIGSIATGKTVSGVTISGNTVTNSMYGLRIKVQKSATNAKVSGITYSGNTISGITKYGVLISQSYPADDGTPGTGGPISDVNFTGNATTVQVGTKAKRMTINCGACSGTWDFSKLTITGGSAGRTNTTDNATVGLLSPVFIEITNVEVRLSVDRFRMPTNALRF
ncbi:endopolygalacturonase 2 precursor [Desarmillaria tabescens]|uniref:endo-polygalacturonase n=1 Tax=Armillaria tabescens TaxID=1929756 RepID=A0AA39TUD6_ARMTA|nr:endopolygalacturonase 2 precursor [Desarmillaria tabescens]KAK0466723.1 endopolygalacturonase 2 precursor [Desarmillaria tabescens]